MAVLSRTVLRAAVVSLRGFVRMKRWMTVARRPQTRFRVRRVEAQRGPGGDPMGCLAGCPTHKLPWLDFHGAKAIM